MHESIIANALIRFLILVIVVILEGSRAINIQPGDTLAKIAAEQGISVAALEAANPGVVANNLQANQVLKVSKPMKRNIPYPIETLLNNAKQSSKPAPPAPTPPPPLPPSTTIVTPVTPVGSASCAPEPIGKYSDASEVLDKTLDFCDNNGQQSLPQVLAAPFNVLLNGDSQEDNGDDGNGGLASNENGYNLTVSEIPGCAYPNDGINYTVAEPLGHNNPDWYCTAVLYNCYSECVNEASIKSAASTIAQVLLANYTTRPNLQGIGLFGEPYYWWEAGAVWSGLIDYWNYTGDAQYNTLIQEALIAQVGPTNDYMAPNQTKTEGNDDQATWALAAMTAAEQQLPLPAANDWVDLAKNVFNLQASRWDTATCGGGLRWQIFTFNDGYNYKNAQSSGMFFQLAARLARYTGNQTYADWASKSYEWTASVGLIDSKFSVYDGTQVAQNCSVTDKLEWTYTAATFLYGSAIMYNLTNGNTLWQNRTQSLLTAMSIFFPTTSSASTSTNSNDTAGIMVEIACETQHTCDSDQYAFKGLAAQWLGATAQVASFTSDKISSYLRNSAEGAAQQCSGGSNHTTCGTQWTSSTFDGNVGLGQQLSALDVIVANLAEIEKRTHELQTSIGDVAYDHASVQGMVKKAHPYNSSLSSTYQAVGGYVRSDWAAVNYGGYWSKDVVRLGSLNVADHQFEEWTSASCYSVGCIPVGYDGVLGLAPPWNPTIETRNMLSSLLAQKLLDKPIFSLKLPIFEDEEGELLFGATDPNLHSSDFISLPVMNATAHNGFNHDAWTVPASHIHFDSPHPLDQPLAKNAYALLDTSSPYLILPSVLARNLTAVIGAVRGPWWLKHIPCERRQELPLLTFTLGGHDFSISAFEYTLETEELIPRAGRICITTFMAADEFSLPRDHNAIQQRHDN
ncbi:hypothetical protein P7C71_g2099, partial [Lecanoromycetidae sp. Uapishka_2]